MMHEDSSSGAAVFQTAAPATNEGTSFGGYVETKCLTDSPENQGLSMNSSKKFAHIDTIELIDGAASADLEHSRQMNRGYLSRADAGRLARQVSRWHRAGKITAKASALADAMIWTLRRDGARCIKASLTKLAEKSGVSRAQVARLLPILEKLGLFRKTRVRFLMPWLGGIASRQGSSVYELADPAEICDSNTESHGETVNLKPRLLSIFLPKNWRRSERDTPIKAQETESVPTAAELQAKFVQEWQTERQKKFQFAAI